MDKKPNKDTKFDPRENYNYNIQLITLMQLLIYFINRHPSFQFPSLIVNSGYVHVFIQIN